MAEHHLEVEVVALDMACRRCWATVRRLPREAAELWAGAHQDPVVVQAHVRHHDHVHLWRKR